MVSTSDNVPSFDWWPALARVWASVEAVRDGRALYVLLASFAAGGLALGQAQGAMSQNAAHWAIAWGAAALFIAFYGANAAGLLMMDRALGRPERDVVVAMQDALGVAHRVLVALALVLSCVAVAAVAVLGLFWLCSLPGIGPWLFMLVVPLTVVVLGLALVAGASVIGPMAGPAVWAGASSWGSACMLWTMVRRQLLEAAVLMAALSVITALVGAGMSFIVIAGGRMMAQLSIWLLGVDVAPELFMAGLFGHSLQMMSASDVPAVAQPYVSAASVGGGVVFALALVLPTLVYMRGVCEIYLVLRGTAARR